MIKILSALFLITASLFSQNFEQFLDSAIKNSPYLKASHLGVSQAKESGAAFTRYANPTLELELSNFRPDIGNAANGYRANYTQPIRLWGVGNAKDALSLAMNESASSLYVLKRANFTKDISLIFTNYVTQKKLLLLGAEELKIAKSIYNISQQRNNAGTISRGVLLQAQVDYEMVEVRIQALELTAQDAYYNLLKTAGISQEVELDFTHKFTLTREIKKENNPDLIYIKSNQKKSLAEAQVNSNSVEWISVFTEYQTKPGKDIFRAGATIPLAFFNTKSQEKQISKLEAKKSELISQKQNATLSIEILRLSNERELLKKLELQNERTLKTQIKLLKMLEDAYKIANVNLLQLQSIKNNVIQTKKNIINVNTALDKNAINSNYIIGVYND